MNYIGMFYKVDDEILSKTNRKNIVYESKQGNHDIQNSLEEIFKNYEFENLILFSDVLRPPISINHVILNRDIDTLKAVFQNFITEFYAYLWEINDLEILEDFTLYAPFVRRTMREEGLVLSFFYSIKLIDGTTWFSIIEKVPKSSNVLKGNYKDYDDYFNYFVHNFDSEVRQSMLINHKYLNYGISYMSNVLNREQPSSIQFKYILSWYVKEVFKIDIEKPEKKIWTTLSNDSKLTDHNYSKKENFQVFYNKEDCALIKPISDELFFREHFNLTLDAFLITYTVEKIFSLMKEPILSLGQEQELESFINTIRFLDDSYELILGNKIKMYIDKLSYKEKQNVKRSFEKYFSLFEFGMLLLDLATKFKKMIK